MNDNKQSFLCDQEWRDLFCNTQLPSQSATTVALRSKALSMFLDIPGLLYQGPNIISGNNLQIGISADLHNRREQFLLRIASTRYTLERWYHTELSPLIPDTTATQSIIGQSQLQIDIEDPRTFLRHYDDILLTVLDCITNSVIIKLQDLELSLLSTTSGYNTVDFGSVFLTTPQRLAIIQSSSTLR